MDTDKGFTIGDQREGYFSLAALVPYKRVDLAVKACVELGVPLKLAGVGPEESNLRELAGSGNADSLGRVGHEEAVELYQKSYQVFCFLVKKILVSHHWKLKHVEHQ